MFVNDKNYYNTKLFGLALCGSYVNMCYPVTPHSRHATHRAITVINTFFITDIISFLISLILNMSMILPITLDVTALATISKMKYIFITKIERLGLNLNCGLPILKFIIYITTI